jgi:hypothetical protein
MTVPITFVTVVFRLDDAPSNTAASALVENRLEEMMDYFKDRYIHIDYEINCVETVNV